MSNYCDDYKRPECVMKDGKKEQRCEFQNVPQNAEYIGRDAAIEYIKSEQCKKCSDIGLCGGCAVLTALKLLSNVPAADVRAVVRGEWIEENYGYARCSICQCDTNNRDSEGFPIGADENHRRAKFCPHCGAKMDE